MKSKTALAVKKVGRARVVPVTTVNYINSMRSAAFLKM